MKVGFLWERQAAILSSAVSRQRRGAETCFYSYQHVCDSSEDQSRGEATLDELGLTGLCIK